MLFNFKKYTANGCPTPDDLLIYQGMQVIVRIDRVSNYNEVRLHCGDNHIVTIYAAFDKTNQLIEDIENALVYNKAEHPQMFL